MKIEKQSVDLNAYISDLKCLVENIDARKQLIFSYRNLNYGTIVAIRLLCKAYDSFGDKIQFGENDFLEVKKVDLQIKPCKNVSFSVDVGKYDIKKIDVSVAQIVYTNGEKIVPKEPEIVEYEVEVLSSSWSPENHFEKEALSIMKEINNMAICFPKIHPKGWICVCGRLNPESENNCAKCGNSKQRVFKQFSEDIIKSEIEEREKKEREETERRKEQQKIEQEKERRKKKAIIISAIGAIALAIVIGVVYIVTYNIKYGLSDEEKIQYDIAQKNDSKIKYFVMGLGNEFYSIANEYYDDNYSYSHERKNRMSEAEKNGDFLYARGVYLASSLLYDLIEDQYPEKYRSIYAQLVKLRKGDVYNDILVDETMYVKNSSASNLLDRRDEINKAIDIMEEYMDKDILNPAKVEIANTDMPTPDYSKVYGINLGIFYYEDGNIGYVGEVSNGQANGFGCSWYSMNDGGGLCCKGIFEDGIFKSGDSCYDTEGNKTNASELSNMVIAGDFEMVQGLSNTPSSKSVAQQNANNEKQDRLKAQAAVKDYLNMLAKKQSSITNITWINIPDVSGNYYYFSCTVEYGDLKRKGTVTVQKEGDETFKATGLDFDD
jgi:hypothetical protein